MKTNVDYLLNGEGSVEKTQQDGNHRETVTDDKLDDTETTAITLGVEDSSVTHMFLHVSRNSNHSLGGHMTGEDDYTGNEVGKRICNTCSLTSVSRLEHSRRYRIRLSPPSPSNLSSPPKKQKFKDGTVIPPPKLVLLRQTHH